MRQTGRIIIFVTLFAALCSFGIVLQPPRSAGAQVPTNPGTTNLSSWWALDETSGDRADHHGTNNLSDYNTVGYGTGVKNNDAYFVATNYEYLTISDQASLDGGAAITVGGWFYINTMPAAGQNMRIVDKWGNGTNQREYSIYVSGTGAQLDLALSPDGGSANAIYVVTASSSITSGVWYFFTAWFSTDDSKGHIQLNGGTISNTSTTIAGIFDGSGAFRLSNDNGYIDGYLDEMFIYKRVLTADERTWLYNAGSGRTYCEVNPACSENQTATAYANQTATAAALTATYNANQTATAAALTATYEANQTATAAALTATYEWNQTETAAALTSDYAAYLTASADALTATFNANGTATADALTATFNANGTATTIAQTATSDYLTASALSDQQTATAFPLTRTAAALTALVVMGTPHFDSVVTYGDVATVNALLFIIILLAIGGLVYLVTRFFGIGREVK